MDIVKEWYDNNVPDSNVKQKQLNKGWVKYGFVLISLRPEYICEGCKTKNPYTYTVWLNKDGRKWCNDCVIQDSKCSQQRSA